MVVLDYTVEPPAADMSVPPTRDDADAEKSGRDADDESSAQPEPGRDRDAGADESLVLVIPDPRPHSRRRALLRPVASVLGILSIAVVLLVGANLLDPDMAVVRALSSSDAAIADPTADVASTEPVGPTLPADQRRTRCTSVIHVGDSTSIGMNSPDLQPDPRRRLAAQYRRVGATRVQTDIVGGRSSMERLNGEPNAVESIESDLRRGWRGCWAMAMGINDTANIEVGGAGPVDMRIDRLLAPLKDQPVLWPTVITNRLNVNPAYNNRAMMRFNRALIKACERYPNLRVYDLAGEVEQDWFLDGVHYTPEGNAARARLLSTALATVHPADDLPPNGCLLRATDTIESPGDQG